MRSSYEKNPTKDNNQQRDFFLLKFGLSPCCFEKLFVFTQ
jgi:hypothetical protein